MKQCSVEASLLADQQIKSLKYAQMNDSYFCIIKHLHLISILLVFVK